MSLFLVPQFIRLILMLYKNVTWFSIKIPRTEIPFLKLHGAGIAVYFSSCVTACFSLLLFEYV